PALPRISAGQTGRVPSVPPAASQEKGAVSYYFVPMLRCPSLAALFDDQREEFSRVDRGE
ncbi:hypothetical protein, partial [Eisenbergiella tayi]|uniref:hypothetical protein n=1 Tax=Eisenbergiella tayi TaxID=1432052 RepID=UPI0028A46DE3